MSAGGKHLISCLELEQSLGQSSLRIVDCRFDLTEPAAGRLAWLESHIPGAVYAHLDDDLSGPPITDRGRHPMPPPDRLCEIFGRLGIAADASVVAYDDAGGMVAARLWWMLRYMGFEAVRVLDGGWQSWVGSGFPVTSGLEAYPPAIFRGEPRADRLVLRGEIQRSVRLLDARDGARYRGEVEPIDPVAGHIPGALNHFWKDNLGDDGRFLPAETLAQSLTKACGDPPDAGLVHYCGSGVSACHNVLAQCVAGLPEPRLYAGSWSEWCRDQGGEL